MTSLGRPDADRQSQERGPDARKRIPFIAGNWKMNKTIAEAEEFIQALLPKVSTADGVEIAICAPFLALQALVDSARGSRVAIFAQTMHEADEGAFTGEVSPQMLAEIDVDGVVLGHSERRELFGETDRALALKVPAALEAGLIPILCVGETEEERERGETERKLRHQVQEGLEKVPVERLPEVVVAYEPIWAIGSGPQRHARAGAGGGRLRARARGGHRQGGRPGGADPLRRLAEARERRGAAGAARRRRRARRRREPRPRLVRADRRDRAHGGRDFVSTVPGVCLVILDGWGLAPEGPGNAISLADTPVFDGLWEHVRPHAR